MTMSATWIRFETPSGRHAARIFALAYDRAMLDEDRAHHLIEHGTELEEGARKLIEDLSGSISSRYIDENNEVRRGVDPRNLER